MPIPREHFDKSYSQEVTSVLEFLKKNSDNAYTLDEIEEAVNVEDIEFILELLCEDRLITSKEIFSSKSLSDTYYIINLEPGIMPGRKAGADKS